MELNCAGLQRVENILVRQKQTRGGTTTRGAATFARLDRDHLGSNGGLHGFQTPLGTKHLFQGWTELFLTTPAQGIRDT